MGLGLTLFTGDGFLEKVAHRFDRTWLHLIASPFAYIGIMWSLWIVDRKAERIDIKGWGVFIWPGVLGTIAIAALEWAGPGWVGPNGSAADRFKSVLDVLAWMGMFSITGWTLWRLTELLAVARGDIQKARIAKLARR